MPKIKTNKLASKKFCVTSSGRVKKACANRSHNTAKRSPKRMRQLKGMVEVDPTNLKALKKMLPYA